jgi:hypothetical protein
VLLQLLAARPGQGTVHQLLDGVVEVSARHGNPATLKLFDPATSRRFLDTRR